jgi:hypothetical protein
MILQNAGKYSPNDAVSLTRRLECSGIHVDQVVQDYWRENTQLMAYKSKTNNLLM